MKLALSNYPAVQNYLKEKNVIIIPIGSVEQHSPVGLIGTDHLIAEEIAYKIGELTKTFVAPTLSYGMSNHHLGFPGTISINPTTLIALVRDILISLYKHGFKKFYFINGHGGNIASTEAAFSELTRDYDITCKIISWWTHPDIAELNRKLFGDKDGHHATPSEISQTIYFYQSAFQLPISSFEVENKPHPWPLSPNDFKKHFPDGRMGSDPSLASYDLGKQIFEEAVKIIEKDFKDFCSMI